MPPSAQPTGAERFVPLAGAVLIAAVLAGTLWLAWRNLLQGRGDTRGSFRLAVAAVVCLSLGLFVQMHHVPLVIEYQHISSAVAFALLVAGVVWVLYMAVEPYLRRRLPQSLISWTRLLAGEVRDPLVAGHILAGIGLGSVAGALARLALWLGWQDNAALKYLSPYTITTLSGAGLARGLLASPFSIIAIAMGALFVLLLFRVILRNIWLAAAALVALIAFFTAATSATAAAATAFATFSGLELWTMIRLGVLPGALMILVTAEIVNWPLTSDFSAWYSWVGLIVVALYLALAVWSYRYALGGRKVLQHDLL